MTQNTTYIFMDGQFVPEEDARISVKTHAFLYGTAVFEGIRGYWNQEEKCIYIFRMKEHFERLEKSCKILFMDIPYTVNEFCEYTKELIKKNQPKTDTYIRPSVYKSNKGIGPTLYEGEDSSIIFTAPLGNYIDINKGLHVCVTSWRRLNDLAIPPRAKISGSYINTALVVTEARKSGFDDAIFLTESGKVAEGSAMNLFIVKNNQLITPMVTDGILEGITRETIMSMAKDLGISVVERQIDRTELYNAQEAFFCGTGAQVAPVTKIDHRNLADGKPGPITTKLKDLYFEIVRGKV